MKIDEMKIENNPFSIQNQFINLNCYSDSS